MTVDGKPYPSENCDIVVGSHIQVGLVMTISGKSCPSKVCDDSRW